MFDTFGNKVRIKRTTETANKGLADKEGEVYGKSTPSMMDFEVIGTLKEDIAINVYFEDLDKSFWFAKKLIENLDNGKGAGITLDGIDKKWIKVENGEWIEKDKSPINIDNKTKSNNNKDWWIFQKKK